MAVLDPADLIAFRWTVGQILPAIDKTLRDSVLSSRMMKGPPGWLLRPPQNQQKRRRERLTDQIESAAFVGYGRTDIRNYYPSVQAAQLQERLIAITGSEPQAARIIRPLLVWHSRDGLQGLPIGPEASGPLGNAYLLPVDEMLQSLGVVWCRYTDDLDILVPSADSWEDTVAVLTENLGEMGLVLNAPKTDVTYDRSKALEWASDGVLDYLTAGIKEEPARTMPQIYAMLEDEAVADSPNRRRINWGLRVLLNRQDEYAVPILANRPHLMELTPRLVGDYISGISERQRRRFEPFLPLLDQQATPRSEAVHLHLVRAMQNHTWGRAEGQLLEQIALDQRRPALVRSWALIPWARTPNMEADTATGIALSSESHCVRRTATLALRHSRRSAKSTAVRCREIERRRPDLVPSARWVAGYISH